MVGQWGVRPRKGETLEKGEVIGVYEGLVYHKERPAYLPAHSDNRFCLSARNKDGVLIQEFSVDPHAPYGNGMMERLNDYREDVTHPTCTERNDTDRISCDWVEVCLDGEPFVCVVTTKRITHDDWCLIDYHESYWSSLLTKRRPTH